MQDLRGTFPPMPDDGLHVPAHGICLSCGLLVRDNPGVEKLLALRRLKYLDPITGRTVRKASIPYCRCVVEV